MARENAYMILNQYFEDESFLNIALNEQLKKSNLKREDKDLCTTIVYGTIQNLLYIQYQLQPYYIALAEWYVCYFLLFARI